MMWLARRIVLSLLVPYLWRWWRGRAPRLTDTPSGYIPAGGTPPPTFEEADR